MSLPRIVVVVLGVFFSVSAARAGGGPETTLLVVNADSPISRLVANEYAAMRDIPAANLLELAGVPGSIQIPFATFQEAIWKPIREFLDRDGVGSNIDCIVYSTDFPCAVDLKPLLEGRRIDKTTTPVGSLTGLTFLARRAEANDPLLVDLRINKYFRIDYTQPVLTTAPLTEDDEKRFAKAMGAMMAGDAAAAGEAYAAFLEHYPSHPMSWFNYAVCLARTGEGDAAIVALGKGIDVGWNDIKKTEADRSLEPLLHRRRMQRLLDKMRDRQGKVQNAHGFRSRYRWIGKEIPTLKNSKGSPDRYFLSVMLGHTGVRGNSVPEILAGLRRSVAADGTEPEGRVYFALNNDVRTRARERGYVPAAKGLEALGRDSVVMRDKDPGRGILPSGKNDVFGVMAGIGAFDWSRTKSTLVPGAICETLSSFGAAFQDKRDTKLSEWIRAGASGTSGTVAEGFAVGPKFPHPYMHVHYAEGCSFAEAMYQSVSGPYQLLVVGDALARPFAFFATVDPALPEGPWKGSVTFTPNVDPAADPIATCEAFVDGRRVARAKEGEPLTIDTTALDDGVHELRVVGIEKGRIQTRSYKSVQIVVANAGRSVTLTAPKKPTVFGGTFLLRGRAPGASAVELFAGVNRRATAKPGSDGSFRFEVPAGVVGPGRVRLHARASYPSGPAARSATLALRVDPVPPSPAATVDGLLPGLAAEIVDAKKKRRNVAVAGLAGGEIEGLKGAKRITLTGFLRAPGSGLHQLLLSARGKVVLEIDGKKLLDREGVDRTLRVPLSLADGYHAFRLIHEPAGDQPPIARLNGHGVYSQPVFGHAAGTRVATKATAKGKTARLVDGSRTGASSAVPPTGVEVSWPKAVKPASIVLFPARSARMEPWPTEWVLESKLGKSKWRKLKSVEVQNAAGAFAAEGATPAPAFTLLRFRTVKCDAMRIKPVGRSVTLTEIEFFGK
ncbi:MAG: hypothetical protein V3T86_10880 [Planctomycetota bacterium]